MFEEDEIDLSPAARPRVDAPAAKSSPLERLREKLSKKIYREEFRLEVPERSKDGSSLQLVISPNIPQETLKAWKNKAGESSKKGLDFGHFCTLVVASTTVGMYMDDEEMLSEQGHPLTFASPEIKEMLGVNRPVPEGVREMFGVDPHVEAAALTIMEKAGYGEAVDAVDDPLKDS